MLLVSLFDRTFIVLSFLVVCLDWMVLFMVMNVLLIQHAAAAFRHYSRWKRWKQRWPSERARPQSQHAAQIGKQQPRHSAAAAAAAKRTVFVRRTNEQCSSTARQGTAANLPARSSQPARHVRLRLGRIGRPDPLPRRRRRREHVRRRFLF